MPETRRRTITWNYGWDFVGLSVLLCKAYNKHGWALHVVLGPLGLSISRDPYHQWKEYPDA